MCLMLTGGLTMPDDFEYIVRVSSTRAAIATPISVRSPSPSSLWLRDRVFSFTTKQYKQEAYHG